MTVLDDARSWANQDPDENTRAELTTLITAAESGAAAEAARATAELHDRFGRRLEFGTAGLRGALGAGPNRMNRVLVAQAAAGLAAFLLAREEHPTVVIGYDGRHLSDTFARDTAELMAATGVRAQLLPRLLPTPVLAFAVRHLEASAGVMVTASHNPAADNGYKVYLGGGDQGSQIVSPADSQIQTQILRVAAGSVADLPRSDDWETVPEDVVEEYVRRSAMLAARSGDPGDLTFAYTAMHGVGWETASRVFAAAGFGAPALVTEQIDPDPDFPTVVFPNPEEPGAMDLAFATARKAGVDVVIANDPDADRLAVGIPDPEQASGWRRLSGNEVGALLAWDVAQAAAGGETATLACSLVSSPALAAIADAAGLRHTETLTGFKWISRVPGLIFGYEEALGYLVDPDKVRDKDGISAAVAVLALAARRRAAGSSIAEALDDLAERIGGYASGQISVRVADLTDIPAMMSRLRAAHPDRIADIDVESIDDFREGFGDFPPSDLLRYRLAGGSRVIVRPSGTEPKLKVYLDAVSHEGDGRARIAAASATVGELDRAMRALLGAPADRPRD